jgi:hypothetical protein
VHFLLPALPVARSLYKIQCEKRSDASLEMTPEQINKEDNILVGSGPFKDVCGEVAEIRGRRRILPGFINTGYCLHAKPGFGRLERIKIMAPSYMMNA